MGDGSQAFLVRGTGFTHFREPAREDHGSGDALFRTLADDAFDQVAGDSADGKVNGARHVENGRKGLEALYLVTLRIDRVDIAGVALGLQHGHRPPPDARCICGCANDGDRTRLEHAFQIGIKHGFPSPGSRTAAIQFLIG